MPRAGPAKWNREKTFLMICLAMSWPATLFFSKSAPVHRATPVLRVWTRPAEGRWRTGGLPLRCTSLWTPDPRSDRFQGRSPEQERERLFGVILSRRSVYGIGIVDEQTIDDVNILRATILAMEKALHELFPSLIICSLTRSPFRGFAFLKKPLIKGRFPRATPSQQRPFLPR